MTALNHISSGYKQTEVGVIPEDWDVNTLGNCLASRPSYGINAPAVPYSDRLPIYIRITDITEDGRLSTDNPVSVDNDDSVRYFLDDGDIVFARTGASVGKSYRYDMKDGPLVFAGFLIRVRPDSQKLLSTFAAAYVTTGNYWSWVKLMSMRSGQPGINGNEYAQLPIPIPPIPEQLAIATALSDVDELLAAQDKLIAKKRDIKQATMQQLLTGKQRLPGFSGEWELVKAGDIGRFRGGNGFPTAFQGTTAGKYPFFKVSDMNNVGNEIFMETANNYLSEEVRKQLGATVFPPESIVIAKVGAAVFLERKKILRTESCLDNNMAAFVMDSSRANFSFIHYVLLNIKLGSLVSTTALPSLSGSVLSEIELPLPSLPEQVAIAAVLSDMDADIAALEQQRDKTRALKQGMMQELLTGRIRLV